MQLFNTQKYPILSESDAAYAALVERCRRELQQTGLCVLESFVSDEALIRMQTEGRNAVPLAYHSTVVGNAYLKDKNPSLPPDHAFNLEDHTTLGVVAYDQIKPTDVIRQIYESAEFFRFIKQATGRPEVYYYECPLGKINYSMMGNGDYLRWHFDHSDFVVSIPVQDCEAGGVYEYAYNIRSAESENYDQVKSLLQGDRSKVKTLETPPGSLVLFEGRYTIHRVTPIEGQTTRIMALLGYADRPGVTSSSYLRQIRYGRDS